MVHVTNTSTTFHCLDTWEQNVLCLQVDTEAGVHFCLVQTQFKYYLSLSMGQSMHNINRSDSTRIDKSVDQPLWDLDKLMERHDILHEHSWSPEDELYRLWLTTSVTCLTFQGFSKMSWKQSDRLSWQLVRIRLTPRGRTLITLVIAWLVL